MDTRSVTPASYGEVSLLLGAAGEGVAEPDVCANSSQVSRLSIGFQQSETRGRCFFVTRSRT